MVGGKEAALPFVATVTPAATEEGVCQRPARSLVPGRAALCSVFATRRLGGHNGNPREK